MVKYINFVVGHEWTTEAAENYLLYGLEPGGFLEAVIINDLYLAASRADHLNRPILSDIMKSVFHNFPVGSFGNRTSYRNWLNDKDGCRSAYRDRVEKDHTIEIMTRK